jgi:hypothetical protein
MSVAFAVMIVFSSIAVGCGVFAAIPGAIRYSVWKLLK